MRLITVVVIVITKFFNVGLANNLHLTFGKATATRKFSADATVAVSLEDTPAGSDAFILFSAPILLS